MGNGTSTTAFDAHCGGERSEGAIARVQDLATGDGSRPAVVFPKDKEAVSMSYGAGTVARDAHVIGKGAETHLVLKGSNPKGKKHKTSGERDTWRGKNPWHPYPQFKPTMHTFGHTKVSDVPNDTAPLAVRTGRHEQHAYATSRAEEV